MTTWQNYEQVAAHVLNDVREHFGLEAVEGKQKLAGLRSGTDWEIDAKGLREIDGAVIVVECRCYSKPLTQEALAAVAYRIRDMGAGGGITVSPHPLQKGAAKVADAEGIRHLQLDRDSTAQQWKAEIENLVMLGFQDRVNLSMSESITFTITHGDGTVETKTVNG